MDEYTSCALKMDTNGIIDYINTTAPQTLPEYLAEKISEQDKKIEELEEKISRLFNMVEDLRIWLVL